MGTVRVLLVSGFQCSAAQKLAGDLISQFTFVLVEAGGVVPAAQTCILSECLVIIYPGSLFF